MHVIIHIGAPKAGSSSLQDALASNREALASRGVLYPRLGRANHHNSLSAALQARGKTKSHDLRRFGNDLAKVEQGMRAAWTAVEKQVQHAQPRVLLLSTEGFMSIERFDFLKQALARVAPDAKITVACYLRSPVSNHESKVSQRLGWTWRVRLPAPLDWHGRIKNWQEIGSVELRDLASVGDVSTDFVKTFLPDFTDIFRVPAVRRNVSLTGEGAIALQARLMALGTDDEATIVAASPEWRAQLMRVEEAERQALSLRRIAVKEPVRWLILDGWHTQALALKRDYGFVFDEPALYDRAALDAGLAKTNAKALGLAETDSLARFLDNDPAAAVQLLAKAVTKRPARRVLGQGVAKRFWNAMPTAIRLDGRAR